TSNTDNEQHLLTYKLDKFAGSTGLQCGSIYTADWSKTWIHSSRRLIMTASI
ncbi:unnamed protein product, partial [Rotaria magnacalcarata]